MMTSEGFSMTLNSAPNVDRSKFFTHNAGLLVGERRMASSNNTWQEMANMK